jgi:hypothetical protein
VKIVDSATATASALTELLEINGLEAPADAATPVHVQLTTGDVDAFRAVARRLFGEAFLDVEGVSLGAAGSGAAEADTSAETAPRPPTATVRS